MFSSRLRCSVAIAATLLLVSTTAACGGGDDDEAAASEPSSTTSEPATTTTVAPIIAPLSGEVDTAGVTQTRAALTVKIDNTRNAQPQYGIDQADIVWEEIVEGGITRLAVMFQSKAPEKIGPIRSVRKTDAGLVWPVGGLFAYSGGAAYAVDRINEAPVVKLDETRAGDAMFRDRSRSAPFNLYGIGEALFAKGGEPVPPPPLFHYRDPLAPVPGSTPANAFNVGFRAGFDVNWTYDVATGTYARSLFGEPVVTGTGAPVRPRNVVVLFVDYAGGAGVEQSEAVMTGTGEAWVFSAGMLVKGTWRRDSIEQPTRLLDAAGADITLVPGQTWVALPAIGYPVPVTG